MKSREVSSKSDKKVEKAINSFGKKTLQKLQHKSINKAYNIIPIQGYNYYNSVFLLDIYIYMQDTNKCKFKQITLH